MTAPLEDPPVHYAVLPEDPKVAPVALCEQHGAERTLGLFSGRRHSVTCPFCLEWLHA